MSLKKVGNKTSCNALYEYSDAIANNGPKSTASNIWDSIRMEQQWTNETIDREIVPFSVENVDREM